tara:strand:- start:1395 stop:1802 length:408 start_codon:yes stop_codon:yes gene_type:complete
MQKTRKWIATSFCLPTENQKVYFFSENEGIFRGKFDCSKNPHQFTSDCINLITENVSHWMPFDHRWKDSIPLPPDYNLSVKQYTSSILYSDLDISVQHNTNAIDNFLNTIPIPEDQRELIFTYDISTNEVLTTNE